MQKLSPRTYKRFLNINNARNIIETRPTAPLSKYYVYKNGNKYQMCDRNGNYVGNMVAHPERIFDKFTYYPKIKNYASLYIANLFINKNFRSKGAGKAFLNIAKRESYRRNCDGRVHLIAEHADLRQPPPHIFYRKQGFSTQFLSTLEKIDKIIKYGVKQINEEFQNIPMYFELKK